MSTNDNSPGDPEDQSDLLGSTAISRAASRNVVEKEEIRIKDLFAIIWTHRKLFAGIVLTFTVAALLASLLLPKHFRATVLVASVSRRSGQNGIGAAGSMLSSLGGVASLIGLSSHLNGAKEQNIATLKSAILTRQFIEKNNLLPILFAKKWDAQRHQWRSSDSKKIPTLWDGNYYFSKHVRTVTEDRKTGLIRVSVTWTNAKLATQWANGLVALANKYLRDKAISEANRNIKFLEHQADSTSVLQIKEAIYDLMEQEIRDAMIAQGQRQYALRIIDPAFVPEKPYSPTPLLWTLAGFLSGIFIALGAVLFRASWLASA